MACVLALAMIAGTGALLVRLQGGYSMGKPGVKLGPAPVLGETKTADFRQSILLPEEVLGGQSTALPMGKVELEELPKDTSFGRRIYQLPDGLTAQLTVVLMGSDRASIHQPEYCLTAQGWTINKTERLTVPMDRPAPYSLQANKVTVSSSRKNEIGEEQKISGLYVYWFVCGDKLTADPLGGMMWSIAKTLLKQGVMERWAYVSYFCVCPPGQEDATYARLQNFIRAATPEFQLVPGTPAAHLAAATARN